MDAIVGDGRHALGLHPRSAYNHPSPASASHPARKGRHVIGSSFSLVKWYMDCVTDQGDTAILYCADLHWRGLSLHYSNVLTLTGQSVASHSSMARSSVTSRDGHIFVDCPALAATGAWQPAAPSVRHTVYQDAAGTVDWNCLQPASTVRIRIDDRELFGLGYAECLTLTIPPWQLPLRQLRWGRFVSATDSLAWIDWQGPHSTSLAVHNGRVLAPTSISDTAIALPNAALYLADSFPLRSGRLGATVFPGAGTLGRLLPSSLREIDETKWRSRATLRTPDRQSSGWAIHEVVQWNC